MNTSLTSTLQKLTDQQQFGSAAALIGQHVNGQPGTDGEALSGRVTAVRFSADGSIILQLDSGAELPLSQLASVTSPEQAAQGLVGRHVTAIDHRDPANATEVQGVVTGVRSENGEVVLELDTGESVRYTDVVEVQAMQPAQELSLVDVVTNPLKAIAEVASWV
jgi:flagellar hook assembly protein FlgD